MGTVAVPAGLWPSNKKNQSESNVQGSPVRCFGRPRAALKLGMAEGSWCPAASQVKQDAWSNGEQTRGSAAFILELLNSSTSSLSARDLRSAACRRPGPWHEVDAATIGLLR